MGIVRANPYLEDIIEVLNYHLEKYRGDQAKAREQLSTADNQWIDDEILHCMTDTRYFLSNYYAIKTENEGFKGLYPFFDSQEVLHDEFRKLEKKNGKVKAIVNKARQMGGSTYVSGELFQKTIFSAHVNTIVVAQDAKQSRFILDMYTAAIDFLPWWMRPRIRYQEAGAFIDFDEKDETQRLLRPGLKTRIYADNGNKPTGAGRGQTFGRGHLDELAFWVDPENLTESLFPTMNSDGGFYVMISTPRGRNTPWHNLWKSAEAGDIDWNPIYIPFFRREKTYSIPIPKGEVFVLTEDEELLRAQILKDQGHFIKDVVLNWRRKTIKGFIATHGDDKKFNQEYSSTAEESFQTSAQTAYPLGIINKLSKLTYKPLFIGEIYYDFQADTPRTRVRKVDKDTRIPYPKREDRFHVWEMPEKGASYTVGVDVSLGSGGDYSCCQVVKTSDARKDKQVACWHGYIDPESLSEIVLAICWMYNEALAAVEVNAMGMVTNNLLVRQYEYENIYRYKHLDKLTRWMTDTIGFWTNDKTKRAIMSKMSKTLIDDTIEIPDKYTVDEFYDFTEDGAEDGHDDYMMALHIALYCAHENEFKDMREGKQKTVTESKVHNEFVVMDRFGSVKLKTISQAEAEAVAKKQIGAQIVRTAGATALVRIAGRKQKVPSDFYNTDWSPIFDGDGTAARLYHEEGMAPEDITPEAIAEYEANMVDEAEDENAWMQS
jgi:hypothetical protein